jgi:hypothetical protein
VLISSWKYLTCGHARVLLSKSLPDFENTSSVVK